MIRYFKTFGLIDDTADGSETTNADAEIYAGFREKYLILQIQYLNFLEDDLQWLKKNNSTPWQTIVDRQKQMTAIKNTTYIAIAAYFATYHVLQSPVD